MSEIETMAVDKVVMYQNTSVMQDEILVHRMGLIPFKINPDLFQKKEKNENFSEENCLKFYLNVKCTRKPKYKNSTREELLKMKRNEYLDNHQVFASQIVWEPIGSQQKNLKEKPMVLEDKILIIQLEENQEIEMELYLTKNNGETHTKWSPVSTVFYKLQSLVDFKEQIKGEDADRIKNLCPMNVFDIKKKTLQVKNIDNCTFCRECINDEKLGDKIILAKENFNYIFTIESIGSIDPIVLFKKALELLIMKARHYKEVLERIPQNQVNLCQIKKINISNDFSAHFFGRTIIRSLCFSFLFILYISKIFASPLKQYLKLRNKMLKLKCNKNFKIIYQNNFLLDETFLCLVFFGGNKLGNKNQQNYQLVFLRQKR